MIKRYLFIYAVLVIFSCKKEESTPVNQVEDKITLNELIVSGDSVTLNWTKQGNTKFTSFTILRFDSVDLTFFEVNSNTVKFIDTAVPKSSYIQYFMRFSTLVGNNFYNVYSNSQFYLRPEIKSLFINPFDLKYDSQNDYVYLFEKKGVISIFDYKNEQIIHSINLNKTIGYCDFGYYNGTKELYIAGSDGILTILDALTLNKITQIIVGEEMSSVASNNNYLFVSTASSFQKKSIKTYNRANKSIVSEIGDLKLTHLKLIPNSNSEILEMSYGNSPNSLSKYTYDNDGNYISTLIELNNRDFELDGYLFENIPSKQKFITSKKGAIYDNNLIFDAYLPFGNLEFTCFGFDTIQNKIYAGTNNKTIEVYDLNSYFHIKTIKVENIPFKLFKNSNTLIVLSLKKSIYTNTDYLPKLIIEKISL